MSVTSSVMFFDTTSQFSYVDLAAGFGGAGYQVVVTVVGQAQVVGIAGLAAV